MAATGSWVIESNPTSQMAIGIACLATGLLLTLSFRHLAGADVTTLSGFALGVLLLIIAVPVLLAGGKRTITFNPHARKVLINDQSRFGGNTRSIPFKRVSQVLLDELGDTEGGSIAYDVVLQLDSGESVSLFRPAIFDGMFNRAIMEEKQRRIIALLGR